MTALRVGIFRLGLLVDVAEIPDPRESYCKAFNQNVSDLEARPLPDGGGDLAGQFEGPPGVNLGRR